MTVLTILLWVRYGDADQEKVENFTIYYTHSSQGRIQHAMWCCSGEVPGSYGRPQERRELWASTCIAVSVRRNEGGKVSRLRTATLNNFSRLWGRGAVPGCLVPGPGAIRAGV